MAYLPLCQISVERCFWWDYSVWILHLSLSGWRSVSFSQMVLFTADANWGLMKCKRKSCLALKVQIKMCGHEGTSSPRGWWAFSFGKCLLPSLGKNLKTIIRSSCFQYILLMVNEILQYVKRASVFYIQNMGGRGRELIVRTFIEGKIHRGAWVAPLVKRLTLDFGSGRDCEVSPHVMSGTWWQHRACLGFSLFPLSLPLPLSHSFSLSQNK